MRAAPRPTRPGSRSQPWPTIHERSWSSAETARCRAFSTRCVQPPPRSSWCRPERGTTSRVPSACPEVTAAAAAELALTGVPRPVRCSVRSARRPGRGSSSRSRAFGFDAKVSDRTNRLRWPHGAPRYYLALLIELVRLRAMDFSLAIDGEPARRAPGTLIAAGSTSSYGGGMPICAGAVPTTDCSTSFMSHLWADCGCCVSSRCCCEDRTCVDRRSLTAERGP